MMIDAGFLDGDPLMRLINLKWYLRGIGNAIIDQAIHTEGMTREQAMKLMMEDTFQEERDCGEMGACSIDLNSAFDILRGYCGALRPAA